MGCAIFAAVSGSSAATAAPIGKMSLPALLQRGYHRPMAMGSLAGAGAQLLAQRQGGVARRRQPRVQQRPGRSGTAGPAGRRAPAAAGRARTAPGAAPRCPRAAISSR
ncbi:TRAP transporter large permease subunit [Bacillus atrophaeus]